MSPSSRGRGLKCITLLTKIPFVSVALFTRAWIEMITGTQAPQPHSVALFTRAWIEIFIAKQQITFGSGRPLHEGVD